MSQQQMYGSYGPQHGQPAHQPEPPRRNWFARHKVLTAIGAVVVVVAIGGALGSGGSDGSKESASTSSGSSDKGSGDAKKADEPEVAIEGDGDFEVGSDVKPGTYRTTGNEDGLCYWERLKDSKGELESILANDNVTGTSYVTITAADKLFKTSDCQGWTAVDEGAKGSPKGGDVKGDGGMFKVGVDIAPGTYKSTGNADDMCYWERSKDAEQGLDSIIANNNVKGTGIVTITAKDAYFKTTGCKDWKKTG
ncbi:hypothetical protein ACIBI4_13310 [Streptomyces sp. NPDC050418]|uniref:hypothetical protein n=1 Tax=Streptomyces sp. NPDC050418 TaxID=3365612 RepID=UPI0037914E7A